MTFVYQIVSLIYSINYSKNKNYKTINIGEKHPLLEGQTNPSLCSKL